MTDQEIADITLALREHYAAQNSSIRAYSELKNMLPPGMILLHRRPGDVDGPKTVYWSFENAPVDGVGSHLLNGVERWSDLEGRNVIIVEAPMPREEFLPRLEATK